MDRNIIDELNIARKWIDELSMLVNEGIQAKNEAQIERVRDILKQKRMRMIQRIESCKADFASKIEED